MLLHECFWRGSLPTSHLFTKLTTKSSLCFPYAYVGMGNLPGAPTPKSKRLSLPQQPSNASSSTAGGKVWEFLSSNIWILTLFVLWVQLCKRHVVRLAVYNTPLILQFFHRSCPLFWDGPWALRGRNSSLLASLHSTEKWYPGNWRRKDTSAGLCMLQQWPARQDIPTSDTVWQGSSWWWPITLMLGSKTYSMGGNSYLVLWTWS